MTSWYVAEGSYDPPETPRGVGTRNVAIIGAPNSGKTVLFLRVERDAERKEDHV